MDPWKDIGRRFHRGMRLTGHVSAVVVYGCYVELEEGVEGLVRIGKEGLADRAFREGDVIDVVVVNLDPNQRRIELGLVYDPS